MSAKLKQFIGDAWQALTWKNLALRAALAVLYVPGCFLQAVLLENALMAARGVSLGHNYPPATIVATCLAVMTVGLQLIVLGLCEDRGRKLSLRQAAVVWFMLAAAVVMVVSLYGYGASGAAFWSFAALLIGLAAFGPAPDPLAEFRAEERPNTARLAENSELVAAGVIDEI